MNSVKEKILSFITQVKAFSSLKIRYVLRNFSFRKKIYFLFVSMLFIVACLGLLWEIDRSLAVEIPKDGGELEEGIIGTPRFINPLLAISDADRDLISLIYSGLLRADGQGSLMNDLAEKYEISEDGTAYTFTLRENLVWSDKKSLTSDDVLFTIQMAKNPVLKSNQRASWEGVEVERIDNRTIRFSLKRPYAPFIENMTLGILPKHIWGEIPLEQMTLTDFNINPIGSGPYQIESIAKDSNGITQSYTLIPNKKFVLGKSYIDNIVLKFYPSEKKLIAAYENGGISAMGGISPQGTSEIKRNGKKLKSLLLPRVFAIFFNQNSAQIFTNKEVRQALNMATDKETIVKDVLKNFGSVLNNPLPPGAIGASALFEKLDQAPYEEKLKRASDLLEKNGWKINEQDKVREKKNKKETIRLEFNLATSNASELTQTAELLRQMWEKLNIKVNVRIFEIGDLNQNVIRPRKYDALLFGIMTGRDPDPFAFWHSSQRNDPGLNIAMYTNITADKLLEDARVLSDTDKRKEKYRAFQEQIEKDIPAIFLYSPEYIYLVTKSLLGFDTDTITVPSERFTQINKWYIETEKVWRNFVN